MSCVKFLWVLFVFGSLCPVHGKEMCELDDTECLTKGARKAFKSVMDGVKDVIEPTETLHLEEVKGEMPPSLKYTLSNVTMKNLKNCEVNQFEIKKEDLSFKFNLRCAPLFLYYGYEASGALGANSSNVDGKGYVNLTLDDYLIMFTGTVKKNIDKDDNKSRIFIKNHTIQTESTGNATFDSNNLIRGNDERSEQTKAYINKNWKDMTPFLQSPMMENFMKLLVEKLNVYLRKYPLDEVITKE